MTPKAAEATIRRAAAHVAHDTAAKATLLALVPTKERKEPKTREQRPVCPETKKDGTPCTARCAEGKQTCVDHQPAWDRLTHEEHQAFGAWLRKARAADVVDVIGWYRAKQIALDHAAEVAEANETQTTPTAADAVERGKARGKARKQA